MPALDAGARLTRGAARKKTPGFMQAAHVQKTMPLPECGSIDSEMLLDLTDSYLRSLILETTGKLNRAIDSSAPFAELGIDSFYVLKIIRRLEADFGTLPKTLLFENFTIQDLANYFVSKHQQTLAMKFAGNHKVSEKVTASSEGTAAIPDESVAEAEAAVVAIAPPSRDVRQRSSLREPGRSETRSRESRSRESRSPQRSSQRDDNERQLARRDIAIVGMAGRYPGARNVGELWRNLVEGRDCIGEIPPQRYQLRLRRSEEHTSELQS